MTDKQIIIDGVDVSECEFYESNGMCSCSLVYYNYCKDFPNCVYKLSQQLRAKEQECEELKNFHINLVGVKECEIKELVKYKQALTEIKEIAVGKNFAFLDNDDVVLKILEKLSEVLDE